MNYFIFFSLMISSLLISGCKPKSDDSPIVVLKVQQTDIRNPEIANQEADLQLLEAIIHGVPSEVQVAIEKGANVNCRVPNEPAFQKYFNELSAGIVLVQR